MKSFPFKRIKIAFRKWYRIRHVPRKQRARPARARWACAGGAGGANEPIATNKAPKKQSPHNISVSVHICSRHSALMRTLSRTAPPGGAYRQRRALSNMPPLGHSWLVTSHDRSCRRRTAAVCKSSDIATGQKLSESRAFTNTTATFDQITMITTRTVLFNLHSAVVRPTIT